MLSSLLAILYLAATYPIYHRFSRWLSFDHFSLLNLLRWGLRLPTLVAAGVIAATRLSASYAIFGRIAGRMLMPEGLGQAFIVVGVLIVFLIDYASCYQIVNAALQRWLSAGAHVGASLVSPWYHLVDLPHCWRYYYWRYYSKLTLQYLLSLSEEDFDGQLDDVI